MLVPHAFFVLPEMTDCHTLNLSYYYKLISQEYVSQRVRRLILKSKIHEL